jgi:hypothetical protein
VVTVSSIRAGEHVPSKKEKSGKIKKYRPLDGQSEIAQQL